MTLAEVAPLALEPRLRSSSLWRDAFRQVKRNRLAMVGLVVLAVFAMCAVFAPLIAPFDPNAQDHSAVLAKPSLFHGFLNPGSAKFLALHSHVMGTDTLGRDWFSRVVYGARLSLTVGVFAQVIIVSIGGVVGLIAGYFGGRVDNLLMRFTDLMFAFPDLLFIILLRTVLGGGVFTLFFIIGVVSWVEMARLVRAQVLSLKNQEFVEAARSLGASPREIMLRHLLPNSLGPIIAVVTFGIPRVIFTEASLSFIGVGVGGGTASWGSMVDAGRSVIFAAPYLVLFPSIAMALLMLSFTFLGDGLRDALDPRSRVSTFRFPAELRDAPVSRGAPVPEETPLRRAA